MKIIYEDTLIEKITKAVKQASPWRPVKEVRVTEEEWDALLMGLSDWDVFTVAQCHGHLKIAGVPVIKVK